MNFELKVEFNIFNVEMGRFTYFWDRLANNFTVFQWISMFCLSL